MTKTRFAVEMGWGWAPTCAGPITRGRPVVAMHDALHRNDLTVGPAFDLPKEAMILDIRIGVGDRIAALPSGEGPASARAAPNPRARRVASPRPHPPSLAA